ncbi:hypothetical protein pdam_00025294 [Pocillopora damicornis]|uniref:Uncharacterized protein n=2 Tax=Pocillopora TaxID=46730 RepID=A0A3M6UUW9_POCDA|nr:hypothetical protein pdam_00025294 [Pocillopora damicornis]CAH3033330.1 unnamed protein product [Pocillopora meandrina]
MAKTHFSRVDGLRQKSVFLNSQHSPGHYNIFWEFSHHCCSSQRIFNSLHPPSKLLYRCLATTDLLWRFTNTGVFVNTKIARPLSSARQLQKIHGNDYVIRRGGRSALLNPNIHRV